MSPKTLSGLKSVRTLLLAAACPVVVAPMLCAADAAPAPVTADCKCGCKSHPVPVNVSAPEAAGDEAPVLLTPPAPATPRINGPRILGAGPGHPFLYRIPATGERPISFKANNLPAGLRLDEATGIITGTPGAPGKTTVTLTAQNAKGSDVRKLRIVVGDNPALTPSMGWNSWYIHYDRVTDTGMRLAADRMISTGMADYGYRYVNIDDCWMNKAGSPSARTDTGEIACNKQFPDMPALTAYIHGKGLLAGIYTSPGPATCGGYEGAWKHEAQDAATFAKWGFDFLKYDWCSYGNVAGGESLEAMKKPYTLMWKEVQKQNRDMVFNLCQYGMGNSWEWAAECGHSWRTTGDLGLARGSKLPAFYSIGFANADHWEYAHPGAFNDPDYILIGWVGDAHGMGKGTPTTLTPDEQYSYMSMWSLMAAPLVFSGDMDKLDAFTLNVLCNTEVIDVDQDPLGKQAHFLRKTAEEFVMVKELEDGSLAVGLFNLDDKPRKMSVTWADLKIAGNPKVRDVWRQKEVDTVAGGYETLVPRHGVAFVRTLP